MQDDRTIEPTRRLATIKQYVFSKNEFTAKIENQPASNGHGILVIVIADQTPYEYVSEWCRPMKYKGGIMAEADLITDHMLNNPKYDTEGYKKRFSDLYTEYLMPAKGFDPTSMFGSTAGYFDFRSPSYTALHWRYVNGEVRTVDGRLKMPFPFCDRLREVLKLQDAYAKFTRWYSSGGYITTGPNRVYLAIELRPDNASCLRLVFDELYWPGAYSWIPLCTQVPK